MTGLISQEEKVFISYYYDCLCNDTNRLTKLYNDKSILTISFENGTTSTVSEGFTAHLKHSTGYPVFKVFISNMVSQKVDKDLINLNILGQFVFLNKTQKRFNHNLLIQKNEGIFLIKSETIVILNEEIIYEKSQKFYTMKISNKNKSMSEIVNVLERFGKIEEIKIKDDNFECKMDQLDISHEDLLGKITETGLVVISK
ncbi:nuclear transport factor 2 [Vairimorpha necatrix]|uniref:Nuclear transport factor 2 n=1 Tax=Vairimorpha necatrix TaxID=6039 RepID=A0AAX4JHP4_9MICR